MLIIETKVVINRQTFSDETFFLPPRHKFHVYNILPESHVKKSLNTQTT